MAAPLMLSEQIEYRILWIRGHKVMLDTDLAQLYTVETKALNQAVKRNLTRFPEDFMFRLTKEETNELNQSQIVTGSQKHRDPRFPPFAFTEQGIAMLSSVLKSDRAVEVNIAIMRVFVKIRASLLTQEQINRKLEKITHVLTDHDEKIDALFLLIDELASTTPPSKDYSSCRIGFLRDDD